MQLTNLPEMEFNPRFPSKNTLASEALYMMLGGKQISHPDFEGSTSSWRLAAHIFILKRLGWPVQTIEAIHCAVKKPKRRNISLYFLSPDVIKRLRDMGVHHDG